MISDKELKNLTQLARIDIPEGELEGLKKDLGSILDYVGQIAQIEADDTRTNADKKVGVLRNVMREDEGAHESGKYTEDLMREAPDKERGYVKVKKIL